MSWHYSQALAAAYSAANSSGGRPSAPSKSTPTPAASSWPAKTTAASPPSPSGTTCKPSTEPPGVAWWTSSLAASPAKTSARPAKALASKEPDPACGTTWPESFARWDQDSCSWKTPQCSLLAGLDEFSETWPRWGMMRAGECSALAIPARLTSEKEFGLWPTPRASANENRQTSLTPSQLAGTHGLSLCAVVNTPAMWPTVRSSDGERGGRGDLIQAIRGNPNSHYKLWQTPVADDAVNRTAVKWNSRGEPKLSAQVLIPTPTVSGNYNRKGVSPQSGDGLATWAKKWATPIVQDSANNGAPSQMLRNSLPLNAQVGGALNPTWVEWLMGWPLGWTDCAASATAKSRQWCASHGISFHPVPCPPSPRPLSSVLRPPSSVPSPHPAPPHLTGEY